MLSNKPKTSHTEREIFVNEIILKHNNEVHIYGFLKKRNNYSEAKFVISKNLFRHLLLQNGNTGKEILQAIQEELAHPHRTPYEFNVVERFGTTLPLLAGAIQLEIPFGTSTPIEQTSLLIVKNVLPLQH